MKELNNMNKNVVNIEILKNHIGELKKIRLNKDTIEVVRELENLLEEQEQDKRKIKELEADLYSANIAIEDLTDSIPKQKVKDVLQDNRNELFRMTYLSKEQYEPYEMQIERINKIEQELLEGEK